MTVRGRTRGQIQRLEGEPAQRQLRVQPEVGDALLAAVDEWTKSGSMLKSTSWWTEDGNYLGGCDRQLGKWHAEVRYVCLLYTSPSPRD